MTRESKPTARIVGSLQSADGAGVVRIGGPLRHVRRRLVEAIVDPGRIARWYGDVDGDLRPGGEIRTYLAANDIDSRGRVEVCEPPRRLRVTIRETEESHQGGPGVPPFDAVLNVTLTPAGDGATLVLEVRGMPLDKIAFYGAGWQIHAEHLGDHVAGRANGDTAARWAELVPAYQELAAKLVTATSGEAARS